MTNEASASHFHITNMLSKVFVTRHRDGSSYVALRFGTGLVVSFSVGLLATRALTLGEWNEAESAVAHEFKDLTGEDQFREQRENDDSTTDSN